MRPKTTIACLTFLAVVLASAAGASSSAAFDTIMKPYEEIRLALVSDSVEGIGERAAAIREAAEARSEAEAEEVRPLLAEAAAFAGDLAAAGELEKARETFYELSKVLVQYRSKVSGDDRPIVVYCPMVKKSWLQLEADVGNPYHGQSMASCGEVVEE